MTSIADARDAQVRRITVQFSDTQTFWFEYRPGRYSLKLSTDYQQDKRTKTAAFANVAVLAHLLSAWEFDEPVTPETIESIGVPGVGLILQALFDDLTRHVSSIAATRSLAALTGAVKPNA